MIWTLQRSYSLILYCTDKRYLTIRACLYSFRLCSQKSLENFNPSFEMSIFFFCNLIHTAKLQNILHSHSNPGTDFRNTLYRNSRIIILPKNLLQAT